MARMRAIRFSFAWLLVLLVVAPASAQTIYWTEASPADFTISRANLDGSDVELLIEGLTSPSGIALALQPAAIPTVSEWGLVSMTLTLLTIGTILMNRRHNTR